MTLTTIFGNLAIALGGSGTVATTVALQLPPSTWQTRIAAGGAILTAAGVALAGFGSRHAQTGDPTT